MPLPSPSFATTLDGILDRRVRLEQPAKGYRVGVDTVLLAACVPAQKGQRILDLGCGVGGVMLALACRVPELSGVGIELQSALASLCERNIAANPFALGFSVCVGTVAALPDACVGAFDHVVMNPPYHETARHDPSPNSLKRTAHEEGEADLTTWIRAACACLAEGGSMTLIHRAEREDSIRQALPKDMRVRDTLFIFPKRGDPPKRVILRAQKGGAEKEAPTEHGLVLHKAEGGFTEEAEAVLRGALPLV